MPKKLENKLKAEAKRKRFGKKRTNAYVYGTLQKLKKNGRGFYEGLSHSLDCSTDCCLPDWDEISQHRSVGTIQGGALAPTLFLKD